MEFNDGNELLLSLGKEGTVGNSTDLHCPLGEARQYDSTNRKAVGSIYDRFCRRLRVMANQ